MPKVVLHYFNQSSFGDGPRTLMVYGGQEFEERTFTRDEWPEIKPKTPFGQLPVLEWLDGKKYAQSYAICRFLGRRYGLAGDSDEEEMEIDQIMDFYKDVFMKAAMVYYEPDKELRAKKLAEMEKEVYPELWQKLDDIVAKNNGHVALGKLTWGDFFFAGMLGQNKRLLMDPDLYQKYPNLTRVYDNVAAIPKVKAYLDAAPKYPY